MKSADHISFARTSARYFDGHGWRLEHVGDGPMPWVLKSLHADRCSIPCASLEQVWSWWKHLIRMCAVTVKAAHVFAAAFDAAAAPDRAVMGAWAFSSGRTTLPVALQAHLDRPYLERHAHVLQTPWRPYVRQYASVCGLFHEDHYFGMVQDHVRCQLEEPIASALGRINPAEPQHLRL